MNCRRGLKAVVGCVLAVATAGCFARTPQPSHEAKAVQEYDVDRIMIALYGDDETIVLTQSDLERPTIDGRTISPREWVLHWLVYLEAKRGRIDYSDEEVDTGLARLVKENNYTLDVLKNIFKAGGYLWHEVRKHYRAMQMTRTKMEFEMMSARKELNVSEQEGRAYYNANPLEKPGYYRVVQGVVPRKSDISPADQIALLNEAIAQGEFSRITWKEPYDIVEHELAPTSSLRSLGQGACSKPEVKGGIVEVKRLLKKKPRRLVSFEKRAEEIRQKLHQEKLNYFFDAFHKKLLHEAYHSGAIKVYDEALEREMRLSIDSEDD